MELDPKWGVCMKEVRQEWVTPKLVRLVAGSAEGLRTSGICDESSTGCNSGKFRS